MIGAKMSGDAQWVAGSLTRLRPVMAQVVAKIREQRMREARGMVPTHPPTLDEVAEIALAAAVLAVGNYRVESEEG